MMSFEQPFRFNAPQMDPYLSGMNQAQAYREGQEKIRQTQLQNMMDAVKAQYQPQMSAEDLKRVQLANQLTGAKVPYAGDMARLEYEKAQAQQNVTPQMLAAELTKANLSNQLLGTEVKYAPEMAGYKATEAKNKADNPLLGQPGPAGEYGAVVYLRQHPLLNTTLGNGPVAGGTPNPGPVDMGTYSAIPGAQAGPQMGGPQRLPMSNQIMNNLATKYSTQMPGEQLTVNPNQGAPSQNSLLNGGQAPQLPQDMATSLFNTLQQQNAAKLAQARLADRRASGYTYSQMPYDQKNMVTAQTNAFGYDPMEASQKLLAGYTLQDLAEAKGYSREPGSWPTGIAAPTGPMRTQIQKRNSASAELDYLEKQTLSSLAPYAQRFMGYSPKQIMDAMSGENKEQQAEFWSSKMIIPEISSLRGKLMSGELGIDMLKHIEDSAESRWKTFETQMTPDVYELANKKANVKLRNAVTVANNAISRPFGAQQQENLSQSIDTNKAKANLSDEDLRHTAQKHGMTVEEVKQKLGIK
jgi:hypothetical protein